MRGGGAGACDRLGHAEMGNVGLDLVQFPVRVPVCVVGAIRSCALSMHVRVTGYRLHVLVVLLQVRCMKIGHAWPMNRDKHNHCKRKKAREREHKGETQSKIQTKKKALKDRGEHTIKLLLFNY